MERIFERRTGAILKEKGVDNEKEELELNEPEEMEFLLDRGRKLERPDPGDFADVYDPEKIEKDLDYLEHMELYFEEKKRRMDKEERRVQEENERRGEAFETVLYEQIYESMWMGESAIPVLASRYDDVVNGTDMIVEFELDEPERIAFAIDASTASDMGRIRDKVERNLKKMLGKREAPVVEYFEAEIPNENNEYYKGKLDNVVPVVVGAERRNADKLFRAFAEHKKLEESISERKRRGEKVSEDMKKEKRRLQEELRTSPLQDIFLEEIREQLRMYTDAMRGRNEEMTKQCRRLLEIVEEVMREKRENDYDANLTPPDQIFINIREASKNIDINKME